MKTIKTTAKMIALTLIMGLAINVTASASSEEMSTNPFYSDDEMISLLELDSKFDKLEANLREEGILECENTEIIVVLGENDEIVYQGSHQLEDENNAFLTRLLTKADFIMSSGNKNFYKVF
ncbi:hypothetical protein MATR_23410 [Marivirga tractuosa]|uniref:Beta-lactamase n=1 Tax=Marivirga tractuosa (strain ATCC 23168 / DSM 4126 / NBRC 15989 / NCIMB 1408 / VKM B-1430 / H-43) TaxID=643867 RepID=E4TUS4_MARTH|nr:hypothetical protein [Marivirga tractuosa]ADR20052.1 hypothetical protein Ftrac_0035 [Marivirga tractuosa DSM 4126]BDD15516.1 hypothetical protein MATR_23410 [Marivirga tractuosa]